MTSDGAHSLRFECGCCPFFTSNMDSSSVLDMLEIKLSHLFSGSPARNVYVFLICLSTTCSWDLRFDGENLKVKV